MKRRTFNAEFKAEIVLELLRGEKELSVIASENEIAPNQIRNWKVEFLENSAAAFDDKNAENLKAELKEKDSETDSLYKKVGQLTTQVDWLKKNLKNCLDLLGRVNILRAQKTEKELPMREAAELLDVNRTSAYYKPKEASEAERAASLPAVIISNLLRKNASKSAWMAKAVGQTIS